MRMWENYQWQGISNTAQPFIISLYAEAGFEMTSTVAFPKFKILEKLCFSIAVLLWQVNIDTKTQKH